MIEILTVSNSNMDRKHLFAGDVERPAAGFTTDLFSFSLAGWVLGADRPAEAVIISHKGTRLKVVPVTSLWPKVTLRYPGRPGSETPGFHTEISLTGLPSPCELDLSVQLKDGQIVKFFTIVAQHSPLHSSYQTKLQPLMITSLGRSGSTWSMRLFGEHPEIVIHRVHPYETMAANYWVHLAKLLTDPANHTQSTSPLGFADRPWNIGQNPYFTHPLIDHRELRQWFGDSLVRRTAAFCQQNIDEYYLALAKAQGDRAPRYFAEKNRANHIPRLFFGLYTGAREIFVVRDFRDMACSMFAFNRKRGYVGVGPLDAADEEEFVRKLRPSIERLLDAYEERKDRSILVRYEDLILNPEETLPPVLDYIGLRSDRHTARRMLSDAQRVPTKQRVKDLLSRFVPKRIQQRRPALFSRLAPHITSGGDPTRSVNRWKNDLSPELQDVAHEAFGDLLEKAGYELP